MEWSILALTYRAHVLEPEQGVILEPEVTGLPFLVHVALTTCNQGMKTSVSCDHASQTKKAVYRR